jgi:hypothetical protein
MKNDGVTSVSKSWLMHVKNILSTSFVVHLFTSMGSRGQPCQNFKYTVLLNESDSEFDEDSDSDDLPLAERRR